MKRSRLPTTSRRVMAYKVVETDAVRDELVRTLDYLEFVLFEPSFAKKLAGAYLEFLGNIKSSPALSPRTGTRDCGRLATARRVCWAILPCTWSRTIRLWSFTCSVNRRITRNWYSGYCLSAFATPHPCPAG